MLHCSLALKFDSFCSGFFGITIHSLLLVVGSSGLGRQRCFIVQLFVYSFKLSNSGSVELSTYRHMNIRPWGQPSNSGFVILLNPFHGHFKTAPQNSRSNLSLVSLPTLILFKLSTIGCVHDPTLRRAQHFNTRCILNLRSQ